MLPGLPEYSTRVVPFADGEAGWLDVIAERVQERVFTASFLLPPVLWLERLDGGNRFVWHVVLLPCVKFKNLCRLYRACGCRGLFWRRHHLCCCCCCCCGRVAKIMSEAAAAADVTVSAGTTPDAKAALPPAAACSWCFCIEGCPRRDCHVCSYSCFGHDFRYSTVYPLPRVPWEVWVVTCRGPHKCPAKIVRTYMTCYPTYPGTLPG